MINRQSNHRARQVGNQVRTPRDNHLGVQVVSLLKHLPVSLVGFLPFDHPVGRVYILVVSRVVVHRGILVRSRQVIRLDNQLDIQVGNQVRTPQDNHRVSQAVNQLGGHQVNHRARQVGDLVDARVVSLQVFLVGNQQ